MRRAELALSNFVTEPLTEKAAILVETNDSRGTDVVHRIVCICVVGTFIRVSLADIDVAIATERDHHGLPKQALSFRFIPVPSSTALANRQQQLSIVTDLHHRRAVGRRNPDVVVCIDRHAVRLVLIADDIRPDLENQLVAWVELEQLRLSRIGALKHPQIVFRVERNGRHSAKPWRQHIRIRERVAHCLLPLHTRQRLSADARSFAAQRRATARWRVGERACWRGDSGRTSAVSTRRNRDAT